MAYQSKTYSLSDEVVAAIEDARAKGLTPNKFLRRILGIDTEDVPDIHGTPITYPDDRRQNSRSMREKGDVKQ